MGGLLSSASRYLDTKQKLIEDSLFPGDAEEVQFHFHSSPTMDLLSRIPPPGKAQAMLRRVTDKEGNKQQHVLTFDNNLKAVLAERKFKDLEQALARKDAEIEQLQQSDREWEQYASQQVKQHYAVEGRSNQIVTKLLEFVAHQGNKDEPSLADPAVVCVPSDRGQAAVTHHRCGVL